MKLYQQMRASDDGTGDIASYLDGPKLSNAEVETLIRPVTDEDKVVRSLATGKALGPNDFLATFYRAYWPIIRREVLNAIHFLFNNTCMPGSEHILFWSPKIPIQNLFVIIG